MITNKPKVTSKTTGVGKCKKTIVMGSKENPLSVFSEYQFIIIDFNGHDFRTVPINGRDLERVSRVEES